MTRVPCLRASSSTDRAEQASATFVRLGTPLPENAWENLLYVNRAPWWGDDSTWHSVDISLDPGGKGIVVTNPMTEASDVSRVTLPADADAAAALVEEKLAHVEVTK